MGYWVKVMSDLKKIFWLIFFKCRRLEKLQLDLTSYTQYEDSLSY